jgi:hypothetical protein
LLEDLANDRQVRIKVSSDGLGNIAEGLKNSRLELVGGSLFGRSALDVNHGISEKQSHLESLE